MVEFDIQVAAFNNWHRLDWDVLLFHISGSIFTEAPAVASRRRWGSLERPQRWLLSNAEIYGRS